MTADAAHSVAGRLPVADWKAPLTGPGSDYAKLSRSVRAAGLLRRRPGYYSIKIAANLLMLAAGWAAFFLLGVPALLVLVAAATTWGIQVGFRQGAPLQGWLAGAAGVVWAGAELAALVLNAPKGRVFA